MQFSLFYFPQLGSGDPRAPERGMIGNDPDEFDYLLEDLKLHAQLAEEIGFYGIYFAEHHFDVEGFEVCHNPLLFDMWVAMHTRSIKVGQMGLVLPSWNPLRLAEDIATLSHMLGDRFELGFARGVQSREVQPLAASYHVGEALYGGPELDERNRRLFTENYNIIMAGLTQDLFDFHGEFHTIPPEGLVWSNPATQKYGGGVTPDGKVTHLGIVPKLKGRKMPVRWQAFTASEATMRWAAREHMNLAMFELRPHAQRQFQRAYVEESEASGRKIGYGEGIAYIRKLLCMEDGDEARSVDQAATDKLWGEWFVGTGFTEAFRLPTDDPDKPLEYSYELVYDRGFTFAGNPDEISRQIDQILDNTNCEHLVWQYDTGGVPRDILLRSLELFAEKVMPRFDQAFTPVPMPPAE